MGGMARPMMPRGKVNRRGTSMAADGWGDYYLVVGRKGARCPNKGIGPTGVGWREPTVEPDESKLTRRRDLPVLT